MEEKIKLANLFYDVVCDFKKTLQSKNDDNTNESNKYKLAENLITDFLMRDSMYFVLRQNKSNSITELIRLLSSQSGTGHLLSKLQLTFDDPDDYISQIKNLDYITKDIVNKEQLSTIVKRNFKYDDDFNKFDYLELYYKYKDLEDKLSAYYKQFN